MNIFHTFLQAAESTAAETTAAAATSAPVVPTGYGDTVVSNLTIGFLVAGMVILVLAAIVAFVFIKPKMQRWGQSFLYGVVSYLFFSFFAPSMILMALMAIPAVNETLTNNSQLLQVTRLILSVIGGILAILVGILLVKKSGKYREDYPINVGDAILFAIGAYIVSVLVGQQLTYDYNYIGVASTVNEFGFDQTIAIMVENGAEFNAAVEQLYTFATRSPWDFLFDNLVYLFQGVLLIGLSVMAYGVIVKKLSGVYYALICLFLIGFFLPSGLGIFISLSTGIWTAICAVVAVVCFVVAFVVVSRYLPEDWLLLTLKKEKLEPPTKMPKIKMPD